MSRPFDKISRHLTKSVGVLFGRVDVAREHFRARAAVAAGIALAAASICGGCGPSSPRPDERGEPVVLVHPFEVRGQDEGADYVGRALAGSLAANLAQADDLRILEISTSAETTVDDAKDLEPPAVERATREVVGTLTRDGATVHVDLMLFDPGQDAPLWETRVSAEGGNLSGIVSRLAIQTVRELGGSYPVLYDFIAEVKGGPQMSDSSLITLALEAERRNDIDGFLQASSDLIAHYPDESAAHVLHAWALMYAWDADPSSEAYLAQLRERLAALDSVDPESPYDELVRAYIYRSSGQPEQARQLYSQSLARTDLSVAARAWALRQRSFTYLQVGNHSAALSDAEEAVELDPSNEGSLVALSKALETIGRLDEAIWASRRALALEPTSWRQHQRLGIVLARAGRHDEAVLALERGCELGGNQEACANLAVVLQSGGREVEARAAARHAESLPGSPWGFYNLACYSALAGERSRALKSLGEALDLGFADALIDTDRDLDSLRGDPGFEAIVGAVSDRLSSRQELSKSVFPWQA